LEKRLLMASPVLGGRGIEHGAALSDSESLNIITPLLTMAGVG